MKTLRNLLVSTFLVLAAIAIRPATVQADPEGLCSSYANQCSIYVGCSGGGCFSASAYYCYELPTGYWRSFLEWTCYWEGNENYPPIEYGSGECYEDFYYCIS